ATESEQRLIPRLRSVSRDPGANILRESLKTIWNFQSYFDFATLFKSFEEQAETRGKTNLIHVSHIGIALADLVNLLNPGVVVSDGPLFRAAPYLLEALRRVIKQRALERSANQLQLRIRTCQVKQVPWALPEQSRRE